MTRPSSSGSRPRRRRPMNLSRGAFRNLAAALGIAAIFSSHIARAQWTSLTADSTQLANLTINTWTPAEGISVTNQSGKLTTIPTRDIVALTAPPKAGASADPSRPRQRPASVWKLALRNGDVLYGRAAGFSGQSFLFETPELGQLAIPLKSVATLSSGSADSAPPNAAADKDIIYLANNDHLDGIIANIDESKLQLATEGADKNTEIPLANVASISFGGAAVPRTVPPLSIRLTFTSGSIFTIPAAGSFAWSINKITLTDPAGKEHTPPIDLVAGVELLGGRVVYLTELDPAKEEQVSFLGTRWPSQADKNVMGSPLRVAGTPFAKGIGVHTQSTLVYELDGSFDTLALRVGLDDSAAPQGQARASIILDGKTLWQSQTLKPGELSPQLDLPIAGGKRLELHADPAGHLDVLGRLDWLDIALKRK